MTQVEIELQGRSGFLIDERTGEGEAWDGVDVRYRFAGQFRRRRFLLQAQAGTSLLDLVNTAVLVVALDRDREPGDLDYSQGSLFDQALAGAAT